MNKYLILFIFFIISCSSNDDSIEIIIDDDDDDSSEVIIQESFKKIVSDNYDTNSFVFGATLNYYQLNTNVEELFLNEFDYTTPENSFKQTIVHPEPDLWDWTRVDAFLDFATKNNIKMRVHGPVGPQSSTWAKDDSRTINELSIVTIANPAEAVVASSS